MNSDLIIYGNTLKGYMGTDKTVVIPENVKEIGFQAFAGTEVEEVVLTNPKIYIACYAFQDCEHMKKINIGMETKVEHNAFMNCHSLEGDKDGFVINDGVLFGYNGRKEIVNIPDGVIKVTGTAFYGNWRIQEIYVPDSVKYMEKPEDCRYLRAIHKSEDLKLT